MPAGSRWWRAAFSPRIGTPVEGRPQCQIGGSSDALCRRVRFAVTVSLATTAQAQQNPQHAAQATPSALSAVRAPSAGAAACPGNPNALGVARVVEIDTTGGPGFGFEHFRAHDFLRHKEVLLTFDDGPWPRTTPAVLDALAAHCVKATFFPIGKHATYHPEILKQVAEAGHSIGTHTWSHQNLEKKSVQEAIDEIEKGVSAVRQSAGAPTAPFFRFPALAIRRSS